MSHLVRRVLVPVIAISVALLALGSLSTAYMFVLMQRTAYELDELVVSLHTLQNLETNLRQLRTDLYEFANRPVAERLDEAVRQAEKNMELFAIATRVLQSSDNAQRIAAISAAHRELSGRLKDMRAVDERAQMAGVSQVRSEFGPRLIDPLDKEVSLVESSARQTSRRNQILGNRMAAALLALSLGVVTAGGFALWSMVRGISHSMVQLTIPIQDAAGKLNEVVGPVILPGGSDFADLHDMLQQVTREITVVVDRLHQSRREVIRADQLASMGQLAAGLAHELRNPLMAIKLLAHSIGEQFDDNSQQSADLRVLNEEIARLEHLVTTFLDFARPPRLSPCQFALADELRRVVELVKLKTEQHAAHITLETPSHPVMLLADREQLRQVLLNLLLNALDAISVGGHIEISTELKWNPLPPCDADEGRAAGARCENVGGEQQPSHVVLSIEDNGCGLPVELGARIFEPFVSTKETGTGLGLAICRRIVEAHGGWITANNREAGGAKLQLSLPLVAAMHEARSSTANSSAITAEYSPDKLPSSRPTCR